MGLLVFMPFLANGQEAWDHLRKKHDKNDDKKITTAEYDRGEATFKRLDTNEDGVITADDFTRSGRRGRGARPRGGNGGAGRMITRVADADRDNVVSAAEWKGFLDGLSISDGGAVDVEAMLGGGNGVERMTGMLDKDNDGTLTVSDLKAHFKELDKNNDGELKGDEIARRRRPRGRDGAGRGSRDGSPQPGRPHPGTPQPGELAPDFNLPYASASKKTVQLSSFAGQKPVALIFGSYT